MARSADAMAGAAAAQAARNAAAAQADYLARIQAQSAAGRRVSPDTAVQGARAAGAVAANTPISNTFRPGEIVGGADRRLANGGAVVDGYYIPPGTKFTAAPTPAPTPTPTPTTSEETPKTTMPVDTGTPSGGGAGGAGGAAATPVSNVDATSQLFADALKALQEQYGVSQENINAAIARMEADPYNTMNAYRNMQLAPARVAADPLAQYMQSAGLSDQQSAAAAQLAQAEADAYMQAMQNVQNVLQQSQEQVNASRLADIGLIRTGAQQDLEANLNMLRLGLERERIGSLTGLQQRNLENEMNMRNTIANQIANVFAGQDVAPESILKLIQETLNRVNINQWTNIPGLGPDVVGRPVENNPIMTIQPYPNPFSPGA